jgi:molecular chaperone GrpE
LADLPEGDEVEQEGEAAGCDLRDLFAEFVALRQEIRLQNREQAKAMRELEKAAELYQSSTSLLQRREEDLTAFEERVRRAAERQCLLPFLDVRDALVRGRDAVVRLSESRGFFRRLPAGIEAVVEGYEMAIRRFDRVLAQLGVKTLQTVGYRFDAQAMNAVEVRRDELVEEGTVVEELSSGFMRGDEVLRPAGVVVNKHRDTEE